MATLEQILSARDERAGLQATLIKKYGCPLVSCTMNIPGPEKNSTLIQACFDKAMGAFAKQNEGVLDLVLERRLETGPERYFMVTGGANLHSLKRRLAFFEQVYPIGRWLDLDVKDLQGSAISRKDIMLEGRTCLVCKRDAKECARSARHSIDELDRITLEALQLFLAKDGA
ncbi:citrate lyase holo-[acyl-carrier protein] synthase [Sphaerochaeta sp. PS]|jgi:holo-ACP synthase|uniref:citrate lyase holo-[acyl-carrier protein] synthase n=1 Tax=Sphaerochaeta sp. PS TaxID=3076336 RepID=UPI0028A47B1E|nr:citrate lyase holo-[acyl-carrier protein] synthase [Sphaerochaeta sp. PS]MDT4761264.1 citrate lyase holo-[acyl-carrier protein] synthase [Sphaerochaeta sp. PS]